MNDRATIEVSLDLRVGDLVEVRSEAEILATVDESGRLESLPFMPEMMQYCGKRFRVSKRADKTCDTISKTGGRRMLHTVHLENLRCEGEHHGGCDATCLLFWKEAWLKKLSANPGSGSSGLDTAQAPAAPPSPFEGSAQCARETLLLATRPLASSSDTPVETFSCQVTNLLQATSPLPWWDFRQYARDLRSGNVSLGEFVSVALRMMFNTLLRTMGHVRGGYRLSRLLSSLSPDSWLFPEIRGTLTRTPTGSLNLQPGELVQVKGKDEILATLDSRQRNRGLYFDVEMLPYCGRTFRVLKRVERIIDERTGQLMRLPNACIILEGVACCAHFSQKRLFCPRGIYSYWREIWLRRVDPVAHQEDRRLSEPVATATCGAEQFG